MRKVTVPGKRKEALRVTKTGKVVEVSKLDLFMDEYLQNGGNSTEAAMRVFNCRNRASAASIGGFYLKKAASLNRYYLEGKGYTPGRLLENIAQRALDPAYKTPEWMDRVLKLMGIEDFMNKPVVKIDQTIKIDQREKEILGKYVDGEVDDMTPIGLEEPKEDEAGKVKN